MNKLEATIFWVAVFGNAAAMAVIADQNRKIKQLEDYKRRMVTWSKMVSNAIQAHYESGGYMDIPEGLQADIDAYLIFKANNIE